MSAHTLSEARRLSAKETAALIRKQLKQQYPTVTFSVRTESRGTINIYWTDGPSSKAVEAIAGQYEGKGFDGMIDLEYHIDGWLLNGEIVGTRSRGSEGSRGGVPAWGMIAPHDDCELVDFGAGYIFTHRAYSPAFVARLIAQVSAYYGLDAPEVRVSDYDGTGSAKPTTEQDQQAHSKTGHWWSDLVHQAAVDRTRFAMEVAP
jgi:hypothetical protein